MDGTVPLPDGRRFRVKEVGERWQIEYLTEREVDGTVMWQVTTVNTIYDRAVWVLWQKFAAAPRE